MPETCLRVFRALPAFAGRAKLSTWICTIARRVALDELRRRRRSPQVTQHAAFEAEDESPPAGHPNAGLPGPETEAARQQLGNLVRRELQTLPERYRMPLLYAAIQGVDYETIAAMLNLPVGTVKTFIFRGKRLLRDCIAAELGEEDASHEH